MPSVEKGKLKERTLFFEHQTSCAIIDGEWKLVRMDSEKHWELVNLKDDPLETKDLAKEKPEIVERLEAKRVE